MLRTIIELGLLRLKEISTTEKRLAKQHRLGNSTGKETWFKSPPKSIIEYQKVWEKNPTLVAFSIAQPLRFKLPKKKKGDAKEKKEFVCHPTGVSEYKSDRYWRYLFRKGWASKGEELGLTVSGGKKIYKSYYIDKKQKNPKTTKRAQYKTILSVDKFPSPHTSKIFLDTFWSEVKKLKKKIMSQSPGVCASCLKKVDELAWNMRPMPTFIIEKENFFPGLNTSSSPGIPLCRACTYLLAAGRNEVETKLRTWMGGMSVFLIPCFLGEQVVNKKALELLVQKVESLQDEMESPWKAREDLFRKFASSQDLISGLHIIFFKKVQASFEVLAWFPEVLPTRIRDVSDSIEKTIKRHLESKWLPKSEFNDAKILRSDFNLLFPFLGEMFEPILDGNKRDKVPARESLTYLASIFLDLPFDEMRLVHFLHGQLTGAIASSKTWRQAKEQLSRMCFLGIMSLEIYREVKGMMQANSQEPYILDFAGLEKHRPIFEKPEKQYAFIAGLLFGEMEYAQNLYHDGGFPGLNQSRNLHFTLDDLRRIAKESFQKIHFLSYENREKIRVNLQKVKDVCSRLSSLDTTVSRTWDISTEEAGFYFSLGWASAQHVFGKEKNGGKNEKNEKA